MSDLRIRAPDDVAGVERGHPFTFWFEGRAVDAFPGETVGGALAAAGVAALRTTRRSGRPRGMFCGIGVCFDCLVEVDGESGLRACVTPARQGAVVRRQSGAGRDLGHD